MGDQEPEVQHLVDEVIEYANAQGKPTYRLLINDNSAAAIRRSRIYDLIASTYPTAAKNEYISDLILYFIQIESLSILWISESDMDPDQYLRYTTRISDPASPYEMFDVYQGCQSSGPSREIIEDFFLLSQLFELVGYFEYTPDAPRVSLQYRHSLLVIIMRYISNTVTLSKLRYKVIYKVVRDKTKCYRNRGR